MVGVIPLRQLTRRSGARGPTAIFALCWSTFWIRLGGTGALGRIATRLAMWGVPPHIGRYALARRSRRGYVSPSAVVGHADLRLGEHVFIGDRVIVYAEAGGGPVELGDRVHLNDGVNIQTGQGGSVSIGRDTHIQRDCQLTAYVAPIRIGDGVQIAPMCALYPYDHGMAPGALIREQPLTTNGPIVIDDDAWLGVGVIVLSGVRIGKGAAVGAGSVVVTDVPDGAIAAGIPARVLKTRR